MSRTVLETHFIRDPGADIQVKYCLDGEPEGMAERVISIRFGAVAPGSLVPQESVTYYLTPGEANMLIARLWKVMGAW